MEIENKLLLDADNRYQLREHQRNANLQKLAHGNLLSIDTPKRVNKRLARIAKNPLAQMMIAEHQKTTSGRSDPLSNLEFRQLVQERILGLNDLMPVSYLEYALRVSQSVGRINIRSNSSRVIGYGTGSMVSPRLLITNNHVLPSSSKSQYSQIEFNYQSGINGEMRSSQIFTLDPDTFFLTDTKLDYTLIAVKDNLESPTSLSSYGWNQLIEEEGKVVIGEYVNIIQHPSGEPKQLALRENQVVDLLDDFLHYLTDTAPGSSGAPVFNDQWELVGIHHSGVPERDSKGNILTIDDGIWRQGMAESRVKWKANEGVRISRIIKHIKRQNLSIEQKRLRDQLLAGVTPLNEIKLPASSNPSLKTLRIAHSKMLKLHREKGNEPEVLTKIGQFINKGQATGALLEIEEDRWAAQSLLDYWNSLLYRAGQEAPDTILVDFDSSLSPILNNNFFGNLFDQSISN